MNKDILKKLINEYAIAELLVSISAIICFILIKLPIIVLMPIIVILLVVPLIHYLLLIWLIKE